MPSTSTTANAAIAAAATGPNSTAVARCATAEKPIVFSCLRTPIASTATARPNSGASSVGWVIPASEPVAIPAASDNQKAAETIAM